MTRIAGFEHIAIGLEHAGEFVTLTAPSAYHAKKTESGRVLDNPKYSGATPRDTAGYLGRVWARIRAALARAGARVYGFRICEPHHDATPHWHLLLFMAAPVVALFRAIFARYALAEDGGEPGAAENRVKFVAIDWARGSAAGYVAKYVAKNVDGGGYQVQGDTEGGPGDVFPGHRVEAWASTWGIRQFQQVGGPPVGIWRELRRLAADSEHPEALAAARAAADCGTKNGHDETGAAGNWRRYVEVMGGPVVARAALPVTLAKSEPGEAVRHSGEVERVPPNRYGEARPGAVYGLVDMATGAVFATVRHRWEIKGGRENVGLGLVDAGVSGRAAGAGLVGSFLGFDLPWSPVNNCTPALPALSWSALIEKTPAGIRSDFWLMGAAFSAWVASKGGDCGSSEDRSGGTAGGRGEFDAVGDASALRHTACAVGAGGGAGAGAGQGAGIGTVGAGRSAGA